MTDSESTVSVRAVQRPGRTPRAEIDWTCEDTVFIFRLKDQPEKHGISDRGSLFARLERDHLFI